MTRTHSNVDLDGLMNFGLAYYDQLARDYGTPYFLYDIDVFAHRLAKVRAAFEELPQVYFAMKANPNLAVLKTIHPLIDGLDISSGGELDQAILAGYGPGAMSFAGPAKSEEELTKAIKMQIGVISVESLRELRKIIRISRNIGSARANIVLRVNPEVDSRAYKLKMGGRAVQFGVDEEKLCQLTELVANCKDAVNFLGIHVYAGSQGFHSKSVAHSIMNSINIAEDVESNTDLICSKLNLGGGFGVSLDNHRQELCVEELATFSMDAMRSFLNSGRGKREIIFELGRYLIADSGIYVVRVVDIKVSRGKNFVVVDGGLNHHLAAAGMFGVGIRSNYLMKNITRPSASDFVCNVAGPSCNASDLLGVNVTIPKPKEGDLIAILKSGSYGLSASPILFLGRKTPTELVQYSGTTVVGRNALHITEFN